MPPAATTRSASAGPGVDAHALDLDLDDADCIGELACGRSSFSYHLLPDLPEPCLRLTIRKLDDSYLDVQIERSAAVWELKAAIEGLFIHPYGEMEDAISWQHLWSHFCLCFKDEKLTDDKATLRAFGIIDGDELHFAQHNLSVDYSPCKSSRSRRAASHRRSRTSLDDFGARSWTLLDDLIEEDEGEKLITATSVLQEGYCVYQHHEEYMEEDRKKRSFFRRWFSYSG